MFGKPAYTVTFVCTGNICRSPTAHGVLRDKLKRAGLDKRVRVDSAGTSEAHRGEPPDPRAQTHARARGYELKDLRARPLAARDFERAGLVVVMDEGHMRICRKRCPREHQGKLRRFTDFCRGEHAGEVPDPFYGGPEGFERVLDLVEDGCDGLVEHIRRELEE